MATTTTPGMAARRRQRAMALFHVLETLQPALRSAEQHLEEVEALQPVRVDTALIFAKRISATLCAPVDWREGHPMIGFYPPAPQPCEMRMGVLPKDRSVAGTTVGATDDAGGDVQDLLQTESGEDLPAAKRARVAVEREREQGKEDKEEEDEEEENKTFDEAAQRGAAFFGFGDDSDDDDDEEEGDDG